MLTGHLTARDIMDKPDQRIETPLEKQLKDAPALQVRFRKRMIPKINADGASLPSQ